MTEYPNVVPFKRKGETSGGAGVDYDVDGRLRLVEIEVARMDERTRNIQENMARKEDISGIKVWTLVGTLGGIVVVATLFLPLLGSCSTGS